MIKGAWIMFKNVFFKLIVISLFIVAIASAYYYLINTGYFPGIEYIMYQENMWKADLLGTDYPYTTKNFIYYTAFISYKIFGYSIRSVRMQAVIARSVIVFISCLIVLYDSHNKKIQYSILPLFLFLIVLVNPGNSEFGINSFNAYDSHPDSVFLAVLCIWILGLNIHKKIKYVIVVLLIICGVVTADLLFFLCFVTPFIIDSIIKLYHYSKKYFCYFVFGICVILVLGRVATCLSGTISRFYQMPIEYNIEYGSWQDGTELYGEAGFVNVDLLFDNLELTIKGFLGLFNADFSENRIVSVYNLCIVFRIFVVIYILVKSIKTIISYLKEYNSENQIKFIISLGIILNFIFVMLYSNTDDRAESAALRYLLVSYYYGIYMICFSAVDIIIENGEELVKKCIFYFLICLICLDFYVPKIKLYKQSSWYESYANMRNFLLENDLGYGATDYWTAPLITAQTSGEVFVSASNIDGCKFNYIIDKEDETGWRIGNVEETYGEADEIYDFQVYKIYYYKEPFCLNKDFTWNLE